MNKHKKGFFVVWCVCLTYYIHGVSVQQLSKAIMLSFDSPVRDTWFKKAVDACMYMWGDMRAVISDTCTQRDGSLIVVLDAMVGRLAYAGFCLEQLGGDNRDHHNSQDLIYLHRTLEKIASESEQLMRAMADTECPDKDRIACMQHMLLALRRTISLKIDTCVF